MDYTAVLEEIFSGFSGPKFSVRFWNGREVEYGTGDKRAFTLVFKTEKAARRLLGEGALGFGESYMDGSLGIEGDIEAYLRLRHQIKHVRKSARLALAVFLARLQTPFTRKRQISSHYDLGNVFFGLLLDSETMSYSAGRYELGGEHLEEAQQKKLQFVCDWLNLQRGSSILDVGSGWGGFAKYATENRGLSVYGISLSQKQLAYARELMQESNAGKKASFEYCDMLSDLPKEQFDGVVMIESIEHVGKERLPEFFKSLFARLKPGAPLYIQATGRYVPRRVDAWTLKYVFPGGYLPTKDELVDSARSAGFAFESFRDDTPDYIRTMSEWIANLERNKEKIESLFSPEFYRLWYLWMHGAKVSFEANSMSLFRMLFRRMT